MRFEIVILLVAGFIMANIYTEGKYVKVLYSWKKYYQMAGVAFGALMLYYLYKHNPLRAQQMLSTTNEYIKYLPIDKGTSSMLSPILDFTSRQDFANRQYSSLDGIGTGGSNHPILSMPQPSTAETKIVNSGRTSNKRSVSETKKKFVAARQNWRCHDCQRQLPAWFEVDHTVRLEHGGSNHIDNLTALCRDCHGKKTAIENL
jgi:hypothetical protein